MKRKLRRLLALMMNTFLADCPRCHKHFYGFHDHAIHVKVDGTYYRIVCHRCAKERQP